MHGLVNPEYILQKACLDTLATILNLSHTSNIVRLFLATQPVTPYEDFSRYDFFTDLFTNTTGSIFTTAQNDVFPNSLYAGTA